MTDPIGSTGVSRQDLQRYFDDELTGTEKQELDAHIDAEPQLQRELEQLSCMRAFVVGASQVHAAAVPAARFEQVWAEIERTLDRDAREQRASRTPMGPWARLRAALRPLRIPAFAVAAAGAIAWIALTYGPLGIDPGSGDLSVAQAPTPAEPPLVLRGAPELALDEDSDREAPMVFTPPRPGDAEVHNVEFGGRSGRIAKTGTVTVLYVEEDAEPKDSERAL